MADFNVGDISTWPEWLSIEHILEMRDFETKEGIEALVREGLFEPMPAETDPMRWRRADVLDFIETMIWRLENK